MIRPFRFAAKDLGSCEVIVVVVKGELAAQQGVENDAQAPNINLLSGILLPLQHLRSAVADRAAERLEVARLPLVLPREAEIAQLNILMLVKQDILQLKISMDAGSIVNVRHGAD